MLAAAALATLLVPTAARAYCRTTTQPLPANYSPSRGCFTDGLFLYWRNACVSFSIQEGASRTIPFDVARRIVSDAFATWTSAKCANGVPVGISVQDFGPVACDEVRYNSNSANQNLIVFRDDGWPYDDPYSTLGLTTVTFNAETGEIYDADMEINSSGRNLSASNSVPANGFDLASVITHEIGHFFGLAHATSSKSTMYASYKPGSIALRSLSADDVDGLCAIYPNSTQRVASSLVSGSELVTAETCDATPRHGFTSQCSSAKGGGGQCAATPSVQPTASWVSSGCVATVVAGLFAVRRRRRAA